jgi:large subunit ribosomal protein L14e
MFEVGRVCIKLAGRDAGNTCIVVDLVDDNYVLIDGNVRRRKCNTSHLKPLKDTIKIKKGALTADVTKAMVTAKMKVIEIKKVKRSEKKKEVKKETKGKKKDVKTGSK